MPNIKEHLTSIMHVPRISTRHITANDWELLSANPEAEPVVIMYHHDYECVLVNFDNEEEIDEDFGGCSEHLRFVLKQLLAEGFNYCRFDPTGDLVPGWKEFE